MIDWSAMLLALAVTMLVFAARYFLERKIENK